MSQTDRKLHTGVFRHFTFTTPALHVFNLLHCHSDGQDPLRLHMRVCVFHSESCGKRAQLRGGREEGIQEEGSRRKQLGTSRTFTSRQWNAIPVRRGAPPPMRAGANATSAAIISYSPAADVGKRVGLVCVCPPPYAGTSFDTGHLPAHPPPPHHHHHHPSAFRWQGKDAFTDNVWGNCGVMLL